VHSRICTTDLPYETHALYRTHVLYKIHTLYRTPILSTPYPYTTSISDMSLMSASHVMQELAVMTV